MRSLWQLTSLSKESIEQCPLGFHLADMVLAGNGQVAGATNSVYVKGKQGDSK